MWIETKIRGYKLKIAEKKDLSTIYAFTRKMAEYEKLSHEFVAREKDLERALFGEDKVIEIVLGYFDEQPVSFAVFFKNFSTYLGKAGLYLEDLFVIPEMRGKGFGKTLIAFLAKLADDRGYGRFEWIVLDWNTTAIDFYKRLGAKPMNEWIINRVTGKNLKKLANGF